MTQEELIIQAAILSVQRNITPTAALQVLRDAIVAIKGEVDKNSKEWSDIVLIVKKP